MHCGDVIVVANTNSWALLYRDIEMRALFAKVPVPECRVAVQNWSTINLARYLPQLRVEVILFGQCQIVASRLPPHSRDAYRNFFH